MVSFLYWVFTIEFLWLSKKTRSERDRLNMLLLGEVNEGKQALSRQKGLGYNTHDALEDLEKKKCLL